MQCANGAACAVNAVMQNHVVTMCGSSCILQCIMQASTIPLLEWEPLLVNGNQYLEVLVLALELPWFSSMFWGNMVSKPCILYCKWIEEWRGRLFLCFHTIYTGNGWFSPRQQCVIHIVYQSKWIPCCYLFFSSCSTKTTHYNSWVGSFHKREVAEAESESHWGYRV